MSLSSTRLQSPLLQSDTMNHILDCLEGAPPDWQHPRETRLAFLALAQSCRALSEPALNYLWRKICSLKPLIRCFVTVLNEERAMACLIRVLSSAVSLLCQ